jgi:hypothetical protein
VGAADLRAAEAAGGGIGGEGGLSCLV